MLFVANKKDRPCLHSFPMCSLTRARTHARTHTHTHTHARTHAHTHAFRFQPGEDATLVSKSQISARVVGALGGRAAEEVVFGHDEVTTGAASDLQQVCVCVFVCVWS